MKIVLLGEYSGFHTGLRDGLRELGHDAVVVGTRDGAKSIPVDVDIGSRSRNYFLSRAERALRSVAYVLSMPKVNVVQLINPGVFLSGSLNEGLVSRVKAKTDALFLSACGTDAYYVRNRDRLRYSPIEDNLKIDLKTEVHPRATSAATSWNEKLANMVNGIIPVMYDYEAAYEGHRNLRPSIPLPVNVDEVQFQEMETSDRIVVLHGITRRGFKGSHHILKAFERMSSRFPGAFDFVVVENMPLKEYQKQVRRAHVIVDQANSYSCGMNALMALAMGKVVLGGAEPESLSLYKGDEIPVINILPSSESVQSALEKVMEAKSSLPELGRQGRDFVERHHDHRLVAKRYLDEWVR